MVARLHQVASDPKEIIDRSMDREEPLDLSQRLEAAHVAFALAGGGPRSAEAQATQRAGPIPR